MGRGDLNWLLILLKYIRKTRFDILLEYRLEYRVAGFGFRNPWRSFGWPCDLRRSYSKNREVYASLSLHPRRVLDDLSALQTVRLR